MLLIKKISYLIILNLLFLQINTLVVKSEKNEFEFLNENNEKSIRITINQSNDVSPSLFITNDEYIIAFASKRSGNYDIWVTKSRNGIDWSAPIQANGNSSYDHYPKIIKNNNEYIIAYISISYSNHSSNYNILMTRSLTGQNWNKPISIVKISTDGTKISSFSLKVINNQIVLIYAINNIHYPYNSKLFLIVSKDSYTWTKPINIYSEIYDDIGNLENPYIHDLDFIMRYNGSYVITYSTTGGYIINSKDIYNWSKPNPYLSSQSLYYPIAQNPSLLEINNKILIIFNNDGIWKNLDTIKWKKISDFNFNESSIILDESGTYWVAEVTEVYENKDIIFYGISRPSAYIYSILPNPANVNQKIIFKGNTNNSISPIETYYWRSNLDGFLSNLSSFNISNLSIGEHTIYFKIQDELGIWSEESEQTLIIIENKGNIKRKSHFTYIFNILLTILIIVVIVYLIKCIYRKKGRV